MFYIIFFSLHGLINYYIFIRGWHAIPEVKIIKFLYAAIVIILILSSAFEMILYRLPYSPQVKIVHWIGSVWYGYMTYLFLLILLVDITRLLIYLSCIKISVLVDNYSLIKIILFFVILIASSGILIVGYVNARELHITELSLKINKNAGKLKSLNIVMISDLHINRIIGREKISMIAEKVNSLNPDIILIPGDIVDSYIGPFIEDDICGVFMEMNPEYGIYAVTGNHEFYGDIDETISVLEGCGIKFLRDKSVKIDESFYITGREDRTGEKYYKAPPRSGISELLKKTDLKLPVILMDHNPTDLSDSYKSGVDLQLSGHTHAGQLFPYNLIVSRIYEVAWGYAVKGSTNYYISCGAGSWGPPVRIGSYSEIVNIRLEFIENGE